MPLKPLDNLSILAIVDNEVDPLSPAPPIVSATGRIHDVGITKGKHLTHLHGDENVKEVALEQLCCGAHGLSLMLTGTSHGVKQTLLFDTGPTVSIFESNAKRLAPPLQDISHVHLSHWHCDHSGGMTSAVRMITEAKAAHSPSSPPVVVDLHPKRPAYRGFALPNSSILALEPDPTFEAIEQAGGKIDKRDDVHEVLDDYFLVSGEIPRVTSYEVGMPRAMRYENDSWVSDPLIMDERFVVCHVKDKGLVLFTGCSHAGVVNAAKHSLTLCPGIPLYAVVGGYHLVDGDMDQIRATVADLKTLGVKVLLAGHCTGWRAKFELEKAMPGSLVPSFVGITTVI